MRTAIGLIMFSVLAFMGCKEDPQRYFIENDVILNEGKNEFHLPEPQRIIHPKVDLRLIVNGSWDVRPPWKDLELEGENVSLSAKFVLEDGSRVTSQSLGISVGREKRSLVISFPSVEHGRTINSVVIDTSARMSCEEMILFQWKPK